MTKKDLANSLLERLRKLNFEFCDYYEDAGIKNDTDIDVTLMYNNYFSNNMSFDIRLDLYKNKLLFIMGFTAEGESEFFDIILEKEIKNKKDEDFCISKVKTILIQEANCLIKNLNSILGDISGLK